jgi:hypothetical protein
MVTFISGRPERRRTERRTGQARTEQRTGPVKTVYGRDCREEVAVRGRHLHPRDADEVVVGGEAGRTQGLVDLVVVGDDDRIEPDVGRVFEEESDRLAARGRRRQPET